MSTKGVPPDKASFQAQLNETYGQLEAEYHALVIKYGWNSQPENKRPFAKLENELNYANEDVRLMLNRDYPTESDLNKLYTEFKIRESKSKGIIHQLEGEFIRLAKEKEAAEKHEDIIRKEKETQQDDQQKTLMQEHHNVQKQTQEKNIQELAKVVEKPIERIQETEKEIVSNKLTKIRAQLKDLVKEQDAAVSALTKAQEELEKIKEELKKEEKNIGELSTDISETENNIKDIKAQQERLKGDIEKQTGEVNRLKEDLAKKEEQLQLKTEALSGLTQQLAELEKTQAPPEGAPEEQVKAFEQLKTQKEDLNKQIELAQKEVKDLGSVDEDKENLNNAINKLNSLNKREGELQKDILDEGNTLTAALAQKESASKKMKELNEKADTLSNTVRTEGKRVEDIQFKIGELKTLETNFNNLSGLYDQEKVFKGTVDEKTKEVSKNKAAIKSFEAEQQDLGKKINLLTSDLKSLEENNKTLSSENTVAEDRINTLNNEIGLINAPDSTFGKLKEAREAEVKAQETARQKGEIVDKNDARLGELPRLTNVQTNAFNQIDSQLKQIKKEIIQAETILKKDKDNTEVQSRLSELKQNQELKEKEIQESQRQILDLTNEYESLKKEQDRAKDDLNLAKQNYENAKSDVPRLQKELVTQRENEISQLNTQIQSRKTTLKENTEAAQLKNQMLESNKIQKQTVDNNLEKTKTDYNASKEALKSAKTKLNTTQEKIEKMKIELEKREPELVQQLEEQRTNAKADELGIKAENKYKLDNARKNKEKLTKEIGDLKNQNEQELAKIQSLKKKVEDEPDPTKKENLGKELQEATKKSKDLEDNITKKEEELKKTQEEIDKQENKKEKPDEKEKDEKDKKEEPKIPPAKRDKDTPLGRLKKIPKRGEVSKEVASSMPSMENKSGEDLLGEIWVWLFMMLFAALGEITKEVARRRAEAAIKQVQPMLEDMAHVVDKRNKLEKKIKDFKEKYPEPRTVSQNEKLEKWEKKLRGYNEGLEDFKTHIQKIVDTNKQKNEMSKKEAEEGVESAKKQVNAASLKFNTAKEKIEQINKKLEEQEDKIKQNIKTLNTDLENENRKFEALDKTHPNYLSESINHYNKVSELQNKVIDENRQLVDLEKTAQTQLQDAIKEQKEAKKEFKKAKADLLEARETLKDATGREELLAKQEKVFSLQAEGLGTKKLEGGLDLSETPKPETPPPPPPGPVPVVPEPGAGPIPPPPPGEPPAPALTMPSSQEIISRLTTAKDNLQALALANTDAQTPERVKKWQTPISMMMRQIEQVQGIALDKMTESKEEQEKFYIQAKGYVNAITAEIEYIQTVIKQEKDTKKQEEDRREVESERQEERREKQLAPALVPQIALEPAVAAEQLEIESMKETASYIKGRLTQIETERAGLKLRLNRYDAHLALNNEAKRSLTHTLDELKEKYRNSEDDKEKKKLNKEIKEKEKKLKGINRSIQRDEKKISELKNKDKILEKTQGDYLKLESNIKEQLRLAAQINDLKRHDPTNTEIQKLQTDLNNLKTDAVTMERTIATEDKQDTRFRTEVGINRPEAAPSVIPLPIPEPVPQPVPVSQAVPPQMQTTLAPGTGFVQTEVQTQTLQKPVLTTPAPTLTAENVMARLEALTKQVGVEENQTKQALKNGEIPGMLNGKDSKIIADEAIKVSNNTQEFTPDNNKQKEEAASHPMKDIFKLEPEQTPTLEVEDTAQTKKTHKPNNP